MSGGVGHRGSCACGGVRVHVAGGKAGAMVLCHCGQCRKTAGGPFLAVLPAPAEACEIDDPDGLLREFRATPGKARAFCARCGAPVFSRRDGASMLRLRAGLFDDLAGIAVDGHIFVADAASWHRDADNLPRYAGLEPGRTDARRGGGGR